MSKEVIEKFVFHDDAVNLGYEIITNEQIISIFISNSSSCCEWWGFITTEDNLPDFVGAELEGINLIDTDYKTHPLTKDEDQFSNAESAFCFVDIVTSKGTLQFVLYNTHNGYYGHSVEVKSKQLQFDTVL
jgi:hypothetical protein